MGETRDHDLADRLSKEALRPVKKSIEIAGHSTSVTLEPVFWRELAMIGRARQRSMNALVTEVDATRHAQNQTLANALRLFVLAEILAAEQQHKNTPPQPYKQSTPRQPPSP